MNDTQPHIIIRWLLKLIDAFNDGVDKAHGLPPLEPRFRLDASSAAPDEPKEKA